MDATGLVFVRPELKPAPYFYYSDHSLEQDDDPLTPITAAGSVPTFPAKMHAILTNPALADVVGWAPHGRSWRILKPRDFEIRVLPKYFEHSKFSSFVRQANGWGFRRMGQGYDKNAYYHEYFLRSMPWLCKKMRRPKVAEKKAIDQEMEPDFDAISAQFPIPNRPPTREVLVLQKTIERGPKARMPVLWDTGTPPAAPSSPVRLPEVPPIENAPALENLPTLNHSASYGDLKPAALPNPPAAPAVAVHVPQVPVPVAVNNSIMNMGANNVVLNNVAQFSQNNMMHAANMHPPNSLPAANQNFNPACNYAAAMAPQQASYPPPSNTPQVLSHAPPSNNSGAASDEHFAAGFMAATAYHSNQIRTMLSSAFMAGMPIPNNGNNNMVMPGTAAAATVTNANLENALDLLQRAGMGGVGVQNNFQVPNHHAHQGNPNFGVASIPRAPSFASVPQGNPSVAVHAVAAAPQRNLGFNGGTPAATNQSSSLSQQAMQRLQQFQAYQTVMGDAPQIQFPGRHS